jgi:ankyrin repeat protein
LDTDNEGVSVFDTAIAYNYINLVKYLVKNKLYDVNKTTRKSGFTPLMCACSYGRIEIVKYLLQKGADKNITDNKGLNAFDFARKLHKNSVLKILKAE